MRPTEHPCEQRGLRNDEAAVLDSREVDGLWVVLMQLHGPRGPWDYVVAVYFPDGSRAGGSAWQTPDRGRAQEVFDGYLEGLVRDDKIPSNAERMERWRSRQRAAS